jgi:hypothetical protein
MVDLDKAAAEGMRKGALERRVAFCKELKAKAELYRGVLAGLTDKISAKVDTLEQRFQQHLSGASADIDPANDGLFSIRVTD